MSYKLKTRQNRNMLKQVGITTAYLRQRGGQENANSMKKNIVLNRNGDEVRLFTKHFDARAKIVPKTKNGTAGRLTQPPALKRTIAASRSNQTNTNNRRGGFNRKRKQPAERQSLFTGTSIQVVTKNVGKSVRRRSPEGRNKRSNVTYTASKESPLKYSPNNPGKYKHSLPAKVIVSNLHPNVTEEDIMELFGAIGEIKGACLKNLGSAEVTYADTDDAFAAYSKYHGRNLDGQPMILRITSPDHTNRDSRSSSHNNRSTQMHYVPPSRLKQSSSSLTTKPVVFTVKL